jgi:nicotinamidase-related amidase
MENTALIIIDIQNFYFPNGMLPLVEPEKAVKNAQKVLNQFRKEHKTIIHVKHNVSSGDEIHELVKPFEGEKVISKDKANAFIDTDLLNYLHDNKIKNLVLCGMQTHMCLEAATRAASDYGFNCIVIEDACATRDLSFDGITVKAKDVHYATLSSLNKTYASIITTKHFLEALKNE